MPEYNRVIMLLADGARPDIMDGLLSKGELPAIRKWLVEPGTIARAVTAFPSTTGPAYMPFLTGCLPATCNVPGIRWLDKVKYAKRSLLPNRLRSYVSLETYLIGHDMRRELPTLFDLLPNSYNIFSPINKGVSFRRNMTSISRIWYWYYAHLTDRWNFVDRSAIHKLRRLVRKFFDMIFVVLPGIDEYSHIASYDSDETIAAYRRVDQAVDMVCSELSRQGRWGDTLVWLLSDHGLSVTHTHFCVNEFLEGRGIRTLYYPKKYMRGCRAANMMSGNGMTHIYFCHDHGWQYPMYREDINAKYPGLLDELVSKDAVALLACRDDPHTVRVTTKRGSADIQLEGDWIRYNVDSIDPFGYEGMKSHMSADEVLSLTQESDYPDAVYQLAHLFTSPRTGDVVLSAEPGYDLRRDHEVPEHKGSHGSLHREHMVVPLICNAQFSAEFLRTVDVFPTTLSFLNHPVPANIDGRPLRVRPQ